MTINNPHLNDYSPMHNHGLPVKNGDKVVTIFTDPLHDMDPKVNPSNGEEEETEPCGWRSCQPKACQGFRKPGWMLFWLCWAGAIQVRKVYLFVYICQVISFTSGFYFYHYIPPL